MNPRKAMFEIARRRIRPALVSEAQRKFQSAKDWVLDEVEKHPVSQALSGNGENNILGYDRGTLFGFFGFESGRNPVAELIGFLDENITFTEGASGNKRGLVNAYIKFPNKEMLSSDDRMKLKWENGTPSDGWPILIAEGLSDLEYYIYRGKSAGRSNQGIQAKSVVREGNVFKKIEYLQPIFTQFRQKLITG